MLTVLFLILFFGLFAKVAGFAFRVTWNIMKIMLLMIIVPAIIFAIVGGLIRIALPVIVIVGIICLLGRETA